MDQETLDQIAQELLQLRQREQAKTPDVPLSALQVTRAFDAHLKSQHNIDSFQDYVAMGGGLPRPVADPDAPGIRSFSPAQHYAGLATRGIAEGLAAPVTLPLDAAALAYNIPSYLGAGERTDPQTGETVSGYPRAPYASQELHEALPLPRPHSTAQRAFTGAFQVPAAVASPTGMTRLLRQGAAATTPARQLASRYTSTLAANPAAQIKGGYAAIGAGEGAGFVDPMFQLPAALAAGTGVNIQAGRQGGGQGARDLAADAQAQQIRVRPGDLSPAMATPERRSIFGGGQYYRQAAQQTLDDTQAAITRLLNKFKDGDGSPQEVLADLRSQYQQAKAQVRPLFQQARELGAGHRVPVPNTLRKIQQLDLEVREIGPQGSEIRRMMDLIEGRVNTHSLAGHSGPTLSYEEADEIAKQLSQISRAIDRGVIAGGTEQMSGQASTLAAAIKADVLGWADMGGAAGEAYRAANQAFTTLVTPFREVPDIYRAARGQAVDDLDILADNIVGVLSRSGTRASVSQELLSPRGRQALAQTILEDAAEAAGVGTGAFNPGAWLRATTPGGTTSNIQRNRALQTIFGGADIGEDVAQLGGVIRRTGARAATDVATAPPTGALNVGALSRLGAGGGAAGLAYQLGVRNPYGLASAGAAGTLFGPASLDALNQMTSPFMRALAMGERTSLPYGALTASQGQAQRIPDWRNRR